jgi:hypothetical protein
LNPSLLALEVSLSDIIFAIHQDIRISVGTIGDEQQPILLIDNFIANPEQLVEYAAQREQHRTINGLYPGLRTNTPAGYMDLVQAGLGEIIAKTFDVGRHDIAEVESFFSVVTTPPEKLHPLQRIPHFDGTSPKDIAFLHYLCDGSYGGTSFYRHKNTGYEYVNQQRRGNYIKTVDSELKVVGLPQPAQYMNGDTPLFERIASIEAKFNRLIIYRGTSLHSGDIGKDYLFDSSSRTGRLTITSFLYGVV